MARHYTRTDLLGALNSIQGLAGRASGALSDRNPNRAAQLADYLSRIQELCIEARAGDAPDAGSRSPLCNRDKPSVAI